MAINTREDTLGLVILTKIGLISSFKVFRINVIAIVFRILVLVIIQFLERGLVCLSTRGQNTSRRFLGIASIIDLDKLELSLTDPGANPKKAVKTSLAVRHPREIPLYELDESSKLR